MDFITVPFTSDFYTNTGLLTRYLPSNPCARHRSEAHSIPKFYGTYLSWGILAAPSLLRSPAVS